MLLDPGGESGQLDRGGIVQDRLIPPRQLDRHLLSAAFGVRRHDRLLADLSGKHGTRRLAYDQVIGVH
jgi:hypothetical protein